MADNRGSIYEVFDLQRIEQDAGKFVSIISGAVNKVLEEDKRLQEVQLGILGSKNISDMAANSQKVNQMLQNQKKNVDDLSEAKKKQLDLDIRASLILRQNAEAQKAENEAKLAAQRLLVEINKEKERTEKLQKKEEENTRKLSSEYEQLKKRNNEAAKAALELGASLGKNSKEFLTAAAAAKKLDDELFAIERAVGRSQRRVGEYERTWNGLNNSINQIARELPNLGGNVQSFVMSMSNQWGALKDEIDALKLKNAELIAQGKEAVPIWKQLSGAIFSWNTAISVGVTLLTVFGPKLWEMLTNSSDAAKEAEKANKKYAESLKTIEESAMTSAYQEVARLQLLEQVATSETATREKRNQAINEMRKMGPEYLKLYDDEAIKSGKAKDAIKELTEAILQNAVAKAASDKYAAAYMRERELANSESKALDNLVVSKKKLADFDNNTAKQLEGLKGEREEAAVMRMMSQRNMLQSQVNAAQEDYDNIYKQRDSAIKEYLDYKNQASDAMAKIPNLFGKEEKEKKPKSTKEHVDAIKEFSQKAGDITEEEWNKASEEFQKYADSIGEGYYESAEYKTKLLNDQTEVAKKEEKLREDRIKDEEAAAKKQAAIDKKLADKRVQNLQYIKQAADALFNTLNEISRKRADREIAEIQRQAAGVDKETERQIAALDRLALSQEDYDTAKADIEARAEDRKKRLADNEAARAERQAEFEKGMAILKATLALYVGIAQEIEKGGVIGIATGAAVAAYMATVIATLSSTSVPQYAEGTDNHPGGAAIVGEGIDRRTGKYKPEVVKEPGRSPYWVLGPSMLNLPSGTEVLTVDDLIADAGSLDTFESYPVATQSGDNKNVVQAINGLRADMRNMPQPGNIIRNGELFTVIKRGKEKSIYLNANNR